jgi:hypothetical protein
MLVPGADRLVCFFFAFTIHNTAYGHPKRISNFLEIKSIELHAPICSTQKFKLIKKCE